MFISRSFICVFLHIFHVCTYHTHLSSSLSNMWNTVIITVLISFSTILSSVIPGLVSSLQIVLLLYIPVNFFIRCQALWILHNGYWVCFAIILVLSIVLEHSKLLKRIWLSQILPQKDLRILPEKDLALKDLLCRPRHRPGTNSGPLGMLLGAVTNILWMIRFFHTG